MLWHIGNTTVRTPYRLRGALKVLQDSSLNGNLSGPEQENAFAERLHQAGILDAQRVKEGTDLSDLGRKWRVALSQLGFITPQITRRTDSGSVDKKLALYVAGIRELSGRQYEITPNGYRLLQAEIITAQQECFLRSLASYRIPNLNEKRYICAPFSPLRFIPNIMYGLGQAGENTSLSFQEFAFFVQTSTPDNGLESVVDSIRTFRIGRKKAKGNVRAYYKQFYESISKDIGKKANTLDDYTDLSFRYLKATGIFRNTGRGIALSPSRAQLVTLLREEPEEAISDQEYFQNIWNGAALPTDNEASSYAVVQGLVEMLNSRGVKKNIPPRETPLQDLEIIRHRLEERILQLDEEEYAAEQATKLDEILAWLQAIPKRGSATLPDGTKVSIPKGEGPAYLEWVIWRAFLAIDSLCNKPWEARRFQIDQDFLPVHCAPGNGPDMVFEFRDAIIVVEVTLTASSRQEAAEGEPVRRHVAQYIESTKKPVYGLFIAVTIDSNTANTFRLGDWFLTNDQKINLSIVPMNLGDFGSFLASGKGRLADMPEILRQLMIECRSHATQEAPEWKRVISQIVQRVARGGGS